MSAIPVIDVTDLYHPYQDSDDNLDLAMAFGLPEVNLLGVILDAHEPFRQRVAPVESEPGLWADPTGPRDPGFVPVLQLNHIFDRTVPCAMGPLFKMRTPEDPMLDAPAFQQQGVRLLLELLRSSDDPVHIMSQGSARPIAVAYNREPELVREKVARIHLCMGSTAPTFLEWNVALDAYAAVRLLRSDLPIALYPCATGTDPFSVDMHNCYWHLENLMWVRDLYPKLQRYLDFVYSRCERMDFLRAMDEDFPAGTNAERYQSGHHLWTTALWMEITGRRLVKTSDGFRLLRPHEIPKEQPTVPHDLRPCTFTAQDNGTFTIHVQDSGLHRVYERGEPAMNVEALNQAFPRLYQTFLTTEARAHNG